MTRPANHANPVARAAARTNSESARKDRERTAGLSDADLAATGRKRCSRCRVPKVLDNFYRQHDGPLGRMSACKVCYGARRAEYLARPEVRARRRQASRERRQDEAVRQADRDYNRRWREANPGRLAEYRASALYRLRHDLNGARRRRRSCDESRRAGHDRRIALLEAEIARLVAQRDAQMHQEAG